MSTDKKVKALVVGFFTITTEPDHYDEIMEAEDFDAVSHIMLCERFENEPLEVIQELMESLYDSTWELIRGL